MRRQYGDRSQASRTGMVSLLLMLGNQVRQMDQKPPVTLVLVAAPQEIASFIPTISNACLHPYKVLEQLEVSRIFWSAFLHADDTHIFYNMSSLLWKGAQLEPLLGSAKFLAVVMELLISSHVIMVLLARACVTFVPAFANQYYGTCAVGFSAVLFAMKVVLNSNSPGWTSVAGISLPTKYVTWAELVYIQLLTPNASFLGHLAGILAGILHVSILQYLPFLSTRTAPFSGTPNYAGDDPYDSAEPSSAGFGSHGTPRRSARFAGKTPAGSSQTDRQQQSQQQRQRQAPSPGRAQMRRSWLSTLAWIAWGLLAAFVALLAATNPSRANLVESVRLLTSKGLGKFAGGLLSGFLGLQNQSNSSLVVSSYYLFSVAQYQSYWFIGILKTWIPLDPKLCALWMLAHSSWAAKLARSLLASNTGYGHWMQQFLSNPQWLFQVLQRFVQ